jgi:hypothetical protein
MARQGTARPGMARYGRAGKDLEAGIAMMRPRDNRRKIGMAAKKVTDKKKISLPKLDIQIIEVPIVGDAILITHNWSEKAKQMMLGKQMKEANEGLAAKDPEADFRAGVYEMSDGGAGIPSVAFKNAAVEACTSLDITKIAARQAFHVMGEIAWVNGAFPGLEMRQDLVRIQGSKPQMREDMVKLSGPGSSADLRYRPQFWPWWALLTIRFNTRVLSAAQIVNLINTAGFGVGVGDWRPAKNGQHGMFHVAIDGEVDEIEKEAA